MRVWLVVILIPGVALAGPVKLEPRNVVRFEADDIDGRFQRPDGELITGHAPEALRPLARPPASFAREAARARARAAERLGRAGGAP